MRLVLLQMIWKEITVRGEVYKIRHLIKRPCYQDRVILFSAVVDDSLDEIIETSVTLPRFYTSEELSKAIRANTSYIRVRLERNGA